MNKLSDGVGMGRKPNSRIDDCILACAGVAALKVKARGMSCSIVTRAIDSSGARAI